MKVVSGGLDVLETVGRKTFDVSAICFRSDRCSNREFSFFGKVINEADPDLKGARRLLAKQKQPTLSEVCIDLACSPWRARIISCPFLRSIVDHTSGTTRKER